MTETMSQAATAADYPVDETSTISDALIQRVEVDPQAHLLSILRRGREAEVSAGQFLGQVRAVAKGLIARGVRPGQRVGIFGPTSYEWTLADYALWFTGAVSVPFYDTSSDEQIAWMVSNAQVRYALTATADNAERVRRAGADAGTELGTFTWEGATFDELIADGRSVTDAQLEAARTAVAQADPATIIYTSGTTGRPKGCVLTHANFVQTVQAGMMQLPQIMAPGARCLLFLPTAHVFARYIEVAALTSGTVLAHEADMGKLTSSLGLFRPTFILGVPRVFEKVYNSAVAKAQSDGRGHIFRRAEAVAVRYSQARAAGRIPVALRAQHAFYDALVYSKLRAVMGGQAAHAISGGGPLGTHLGHFFAGIGVDVLEGYGLTETTAPVAVNVPGRAKIGTVGVPLPGNAIAVAPDGEVLARGACVFEGYLDNPEATAEAFANGWFRTGDMGALDEDGFLTITGRKKELIVTSGGKNVAPAPLEDVLRRHALISQAVVIGDNRKFVSALIFLDPEMLPTWLDNHDLPAMSPEEAAGDERVRAAISHEVDYANRTVSRAEGIHEFRVLPNELTEEAGELSAKQSVKRKVIDERYADVIEDIYSQPNPNQQAQPAPASGAEQGAPRRGRH
ncbi:AMP-dependent synthetase/ligase [Brevibacterium sp. BRM-1]|uniref:AMP-dependent synthetase/ligase n=1 Tax=Brevibacterium sp. BRM-1 TaxID=2999062 RepID=UPI0022808E13|nr:AMP-dependent synthetase/ligase [Brevibacterium sp. BRM-1]WAL41001.1 AMP-dependent synthetase/ligase [Brevibacterium sp. BRM-1]